MKIKFIFVDIFWFVDNFITVDNFFFVDILVDNYFIGRQMSRQFFFVDKLVDNLIFVDSFFCRQICRQFYL